MRTAAERFIQEGLHRGKAEGRAEGKAEGLLAVLEARGLSVTQEQRARILDCKDIAELDRRLRRAVTVERVAELFSY